MEIGVKEKCVRCGKETAYDQSTPVDMRRWYVEGSGQLCEACWLKLWPTATPRIKRRKISETSESGSNEMRLKHEPFCYREWL